ncbi:protein HEAT INTOLERANT 4 [Sesamum angolense]|uniref:Protein HEAT INTOLERANT 4 n=1 Tax=Sesamum angolense TaxID=2727404 RepID=A0AAE1XGT8_9LAMI|nr:protein HEAT INTOLERANT 4 [Sesamum angolense]
MRKGTKRKTTHKGESPSKPAEDQKNGGAIPSKPEKNHLEESRKPERSKKAAAQGRPKRAKVSTPEAEPEYFQEKRNLEDLWQQVFPVGTEWDQLDMVYQYKWNFSNLEDAFEEGGELYHKKVYLFCCTEPQLVSFQGQGKVTMIPVVVAVVSPFPPSDKIGIKSVQRETEEIVPMKQMKMDWVPYIPLENREAQVERLKNSQIFILSCNQRRAGLKHLKLERVKKFEYCLPYFYHPFQEDELEQSTVVQLLFPIDPKPVFCEFDWELDELEEFTDKLIEEEELPADQKEAFKDFVKEKVREAKKANREAREARKKALAEMSEETKAAFENMRFYKFYPVSTPDTPDVSSVKLQLQQSSALQSVDLYCHIIYDRYRAGLDTILPSKPMFNYAA